MKLFENVSYILNIIFHYNIFYIFLNIIMTISTGINCTMLNKIKRVFLRCIKSMSKLEKSRS